MDVKIFLAGLNVDYKRRIIVLQSLIITDNSLIVYLYRTWNDLDFDAMLKNLDTCCVLKKLKRIYYDKYALSSKISKKLGNKFKPISMNYNKRHDMIKIVKYWIPIIHPHKGSPFSKQHYFLHQCKDFQGNISCYPISNIFTGNAEALCLAVYGARKIIRKYTKNN